MKPHPAIPGRGRTRIAVASLAAFVLLVTVSGSAGAVATPVPLGTAASFVVLAHTGVTNSGATTLNGDIGTYPTTTIDGGITVNGTNHAGDAVTQSAKLALDAAVTNANSQGPVDGTISADLGGQTLTPGVYFQGAPMLLNGTLTLDAGGDPNAVWVFQGGANLSVGVGSVVSLIGGAQACNVYWVMNSDAAIGGSASFIGTVMAGTSVTFGTSATMVGRALAQTGNVTLLSNTITRPSCAVAGVSGFGTGDGSTSQASSGNAMLVAATAVLVAAAATTTVLVTRRRRNGQA